MLNKLIAEIKEASRWALGLVLSAKKASEKALKKLWRLATKREIAPVLVITSVLFAYIIVLGIGHIISSNRPKHVIVSAKEETKTTKFCPPYEKEPVKLKPFIPRIVGGPPRIAIILDDAGAAFIKYGEIFSIDVPFTISVLPNLPYSSRAVANAMSAKKEALLHLPMEPENPSYVRHDGGMVLAEMGDEDIRSVVAKDLATVPGVVGVNNHMGSRATTDRRVMAAVLGELKTKGLFFVDSRTNKKSIAFAMAKDENMGVARNCVFLDVDDSESAIEEKLKELVSIGRRQGFAVGIGHVTRPTTIAVLKKRLPELAREGVNFVLVSELIKSEMCLKP